MPLPLPTLTLAQSRTGWTVLLDGAPTADEFARVEPAVRELATRREELGSIRRAHELTFREPTGTEWTLDIPASCRHECGCDPLEHALGQHETESHYLGGTVADANLESTLEAWWA